MVGSDADTHITAMQDQHACGDGPIGEFPRDVMRHRRLAVTSSKAAVASLATQLRRGPQPASGAQIADDLCEEPLLFSLWPATAPATVAGSTHTARRHPALSPAGRTDLQHARVRFPRAFGRLIGHRRAPTPVVSRARSFAATRALSRVGHSTPRA